MSDEPSPRPWRIVTFKQCPGIADIMDATGSPAGLVAGELKPEDAQLIVDAVNERDELKADNLALANGVIENCDRARRLMYERDRLRDIVRNAVETLEQVYKHADMTDALREVVVETQREARAAIGEDAP